MDHHRCVPILNHVLALTFGILVLYTTCYPKTDASLVFKSSGVREAQEEDIVFIKHTTRGWNQWIVDMCPISVKFLP